MWGALGGALRASPLRKAGSALGAAIRPSLGQIERAHRFTAPLSTAAASCSPSPVTRVHTDSWGAVSVVTGSADVQPKHQQQQSQEYVNKDGQRIEVRGRCRDRM